MSAAERTGRSNFGPSPGLEIQAQIHRMRNGQDVGEQDRGIERISVDGLQGHLAGDLGIGAHRQESCPRARAWRDIRAGSGPAWRMSQIGRRGVG